MSNDIKYFVEDLRIARETITKQSALIEMLGEQLMWATGSSDFCEGGIARIGFEKGMKPAIDAYILWKKENGSGHKGR